ncbi:sodium-dependent transporter [Marinibactrum halimedae]|uniref:Sodium-dependent transporter n=1 Tax=Marinibactrum halimedae TaxID=1444977 RepID=A0AA37TCL8_9GAMM|nr:sodium-dependent transporter [Marinibactrum halimedae]MCD9459023.1 sodium-dependent transporter [Marinibactrum halimedae]GLS26847.1 sodium-dependent transporter [Marinibactrum halimedae]
MASREQFSSKTGFVMAAAGSAIGLGNIWGFPTQTASNGGAAFVMMYFLLAFCLAYPALMAELVIGRHARANIVTALRHVAPSKPTRFLGTFIGVYGVIVASLILAFYGIVAGWMMTYLGASITDLFQWNEASQWLTSFGFTRNIIAMGIFMVLTIAIIASGIQGGIERWSTRLMPMLMLILVALILYVLTQDGAKEGLKVYLIPDFSQIKPSLILDAMGQAFFSLSLGVGTMLVYGSYLSDKEDLPKLGAIVTLTDSGIAFIAGLLIIPAIYVAQAHGTSIFSESGTLIAGPDLIFQVLPSLFNSMGGIGPYVALAFFILMTIASLTSSISMLEVPVSLASEETNATRRQATWLIGGVIFVCSALILLNFELLFTLVIDFTTVYSQPLLGVLLCVFVGWIWHRNSLLNALKAGSPHLEQSLFWKIWPVYVKFFCPLLILATFIQSIIG